DEQGRGAPYLARRYPALDVPSNTAEYPGAAPIAVEQREVEVELAGVLSQVVVREGLLTMKEQLVHLPKPILERCRLGRGGGDERVRVDLGQRKVAEREEQAIAQSPLDPPDLPKRRSRVGALVVAVLDDETAARGAADVVDRAVEGLHGC